MKCFRKLDTTKLKSKETHHLSEEEIWHTWVECKTVVNINIVRKST
jgi:hypothetical protein